MLSPILQDSLQLSSLLPYGPFCTLEFLLVSSDSVNGSDILHDFSSPKNLHNIYAYLRVHLMEIRTVHIYSLSLLAAPISISNIDSVWKFPTLQHRNLCSIVSSCLTLFQAFLDIIHFYRPWTSYMVSISASLVDFLSSILSPPPVLCDTFLVF